MKDLRYLASLVVVLASIFFVGCGIDEQSNQVGENAAAENGNAQNAVVEKAAPDKIAPDNDAAEDAAGGLKLENSKLSVSLPKGWSPLPNPVPESYLTMASSITGHKPVSVIFSFRPTVGELDPFELAKRFHGRDNNYSERMQKIAGRDALRLEMTQTDDDGNVKRSVVVTLLLDDCTVTIMGGGLPEDMDAVKDQFEGIFDSIEVK